MHNADMFEVFKRLASKRKKEIEKIIEDALDAGYLGHEIDLYLNEMISYRLLS